MIVLDGSSLTLEQLVAIADDGEQVALAREARDRVIASRRVVERRAGGSAPAYGINTGFGSFADVKIPPDALETLQVNLLRSHAAGVGAPLPSRTVRATMALRANVLAKGYSGISERAIDALIALLNARVHPRVPSRGSVGASGDLAPLAHLALVLIGEGEADAGDGGAGAPVPGRDALAAAGLAPIRLGPKEGLALINGTQPSTAVLALALDAAERLARAADIVASLSIDALRGSMHPFEARIHAARPYRGQLASAANIAWLMQGSSINRSHEHCGKVQDAYSLRCAAQVHGAVREALRFVREVIATEANSATDNPMVFVDGASGAPGRAGDEEGTGEPDSGAPGEIVSCGNFHGQPISIAADLLASAIVPLATISERRTDRLVDPALSGLPAFLTREGGLRSGLMLAQVTSAAVTSELKWLAHPAGVDTIPTSANKEDHVSMSMSAALKAERATQRAREVLAIELLCASQAVDLLAPLETSPPLMRVHALVRSRVPPLGDDRPPAPDIRAIVELIASGAVERACGARVK